MTHPLAVTPSKIIAVHRNYRERALEMGGVPDQPTYFLKPPSALSGTGAPLVRPQGAGSMVSEGEIGVVIGRRTFGVTPDEGWDAVAEVWAVNDVAVYDFRHADAGGNFRSKGIDGFAPVGVQALDARQVDPDRLRVRTWVNDTLVQEDTAAGLLFSFGYLVADISRLVTLEPGDLVVTGTPAGVPFVQPGDVVAIEVDDQAGSTTGRLTNPVVEAATPLPPWGHLPRPHQRSS
jgi:2-keto-4-pentenoate hydratase/2-oxohepta-3-ene-1,7-dioic acid hydratase in catechol pathway